MVQVCATDSGFRTLLQRVPLQSTPPLDPEWLRWEMLERRLVLDHAQLPFGGRVVEIGAGPHAIATVPLAHRLGAHGSVVAVEPRRWSRFHEIVAASGLGDRVAPVRGDGRRLPVREGWADLAVCVHGVRSLRSPARIVDVCREMFRIAPRIFVAESLPIARNDAQAAHLAMYALRAEVFEATLGEADDIHYLPLDRLVELTERAGGIVVSRGTIELDLPHALAAFPREAVEAVPPERGRGELLRQWDDARANLEKFGEDHPPVGFVLANRAGSGRAA